MSEEKSSKDGPEAPLSDSIRIDNVEQLEALLQGKRAELEAMDELGREKKGADDDKSN